MPSLYIIGGPNGAGKTTLARTLLPEYLKVVNFVNADSIAGGLSAYDPESVALEAGRIMMNSEPAVHMVPTWKKLREGA